LAFQDYSIGLHSREFITIGRKTDRISASIAKAKWQRLAHLFLSANDSSWGSCGQGALGLVQWAAFIHSGQPLCYFAEPRFGSRYTEADIKV
jgi:hypothetical protein